MKRSETLRGSCMKRSCVTYAFLCNDGTEIHNDSASLISSESNKRPYCQSIWKRKLKRSLLGFQNSCVKKNCVKELILNSVIQETNMSSADLDLTVNLTHFTKRVDNYVIGV